MSFLRKVPTPILIGAAILALAGVVFAAEVMTTTPFIVDDSYITYAFSKNLARGLGPRYGIDMKVEGYSNFFWMLLVALPLSVFPKTDPLILARILTVPFVGMLFISTYAIARKYTSILLASLATLLLAIDLNFILAFDSGLETLPFVALVMAGFVLYDRSSSSPLAQGLTVPVLCLAALTRIDGFIPLGFILAYELSVQVAERRFSLRKYAAWCLPSLAVWVLWFAWRWHYYGLPLPSTYYAKSSIAELIPYRGIQYVYEECLCSALLLGSAAFGYLLWQRKKGAIPLGIFALGQMAYAVKIGGDWMPSSRFILPATPMMVVLLVWAFHEAYATVQNRVLAIRIGTSLATLAVSLLLVLQIEPHLTRAQHQKDKLLFNTEQIRHVNSLKQAARMLNPVIPRAARLVTDYGGVFAYYTEANIIEMWGLANATIATRGNTNGVNAIYGKTCPECYPELNPQFFHVAQPIVRAPNAFSGHYAVVQAVWQTDTIGRYIDFNKDFVSGRVTNRAKNVSVWFLERIDANWKPNPRRVTDELVVEYPFVANGALAAQLAADLPKP